MQFRHLGRSGIKLSEISLGSWLTYGGYVEEQQAIETIRRAYDLGINSFDTANAYEHGRAEEIVGKALRDVPRSSYVLATKAYWPMGEGPNDRGLSRKHLIEQCNASLKRLGVEYVDIFYCHRYDKETPLDETLRALDDLIRQGKVLYAGVSEWSAVQIDDALHVADRRNFDRIAVDQPHYNLLQREIEEEILPLCNREGIGVVVFSPLAQGVLTGKYQPGESLPRGSRAAAPGSSLAHSALMQESTLRKVQALKPIAEGYGLTLSQLALAWVLRRPEITSALIGASRPEQVEENVKGVGVQLSQGDLESIETLLSA
ncbi:MAG: aldo/keto reductase family protein [Firmicutes bacterium]|nr:aldo/keto reductase family protein [Bacillota bacterium]